MTSFCLLDASSPLLDSLPPAESATMTELVEQGVESVVSMATMPVVVELAGIAPLVLVVASVVVQFVVFSVVLVVLSIVVDEVVAVGDGVPA